MSKEYDLRCLNIICKLCLVAIFIIVVAFLGSCRAKRETVTDVSSTIDITKKDISRTEVVNQAIDDKIYIPVPFIRTTKPECDTVCDDAMRSMLAQMEAYKKSGENWYRMYYNEKERRMEFEAQMAETRNVATDTNESHKTDKSRERTKEIPVPYIPTPVLVLAVIGGLFLLYLGYRIFKKIQSLWQPKIHIS